MEEVESAYRQIYEHHAPLMDFFGEIGSPLPSVLRLTSEFVLNARMRRGFDVEDPIPVSELRSVLQTANRERVTLGVNSLPYVISRRLTRVAASLPSDPDTSMLDYLNEVIALVRELPFEVDLSRLQNRCYELLQSVYPVHAKDGESEWVRRFVELCDRLQLRLPQSELEETPISAA
jgi:hypothetical protein